MDHVEVYRESWHARVYLWWYYAKWPHKRKWVEQHGEKVSSNLCPYVRTVLFWAPLRWFFYQGKFGRVMVPYLSWPILLIALPQPLGYVSYYLKHTLWIVDACIFSALTLSGFIFAGVYAMNYIFQVTGWDERFHQWCDKRTLRRISLREGIISETIKPKPKPKPIGPSFWKLIGQRISAAHDRVCPEIIFKNSEEMNPK